MSSSNLTVEIQPRGSGWVKLGNHHRYGVVAESISYSGLLSEYGCSEANFQVRLNPRFDHYDLEHFTPVVIKDGNVDVWSGRIIATPTEYSDNGIYNVECQGWGQHTKDDAIDKIWVVSDLSKWVDTKTQVDALLTRHCMGVQTTVGQGEVLFSWPNGMVVVQTHSMGSITLDLGPNNLAERAVVDIDSSGNFSTSNDFYIRTHDTPDWLNATVFSDAVSAFACVAGEATFSGDFSTPCRYVSIFVYRGGTGGTFTSDWYFKIKRALIFTDSDDESGDDSNLLASTVIDETLTAGCPLISSDRSQIATTSFAIPEFPAQFGWKYPNEIIDAVNSYHGYQFKLTPEPTPVPIYRAVPTSPTWFVGAQEDYEFKNPSTNDGRNVYNRVISEYEDASGIKNETRAIDDNLIQSQTQVSNPGFETDLSGWTVDNGSATRDTGIFDTGVASCKLHIVSDNASAIYTVISLDPNTRYTLRVRYRRANTLSPNSSFNFITVFGYNGGGFDGSLRSYEEGYRKPGDDFFTLDTQPLDTWVTLEGSFVTKSNGLAAPFIQLYYGSVSTQTLGYVDNIQILDGDGSVVSRRGFRRTALRPMQSKATAAAAEQIAQLELDSTQYPPLKGTLEVSGQIRRNGNQKVSVRNLPSSVGDVVLIENLKDPNTGALGRQGVIHKASYDEEKNTATLEIDDSRYFIDQVRNRLGAYVGN